MSRQIEERVVSMQFDNEQFEREIAETMSSVSKLRDSLRFDGVSRGFEDVGLAARRVDFSPMSDGLETVRLRFSALYTYADQTMRNITNSVNAYAKRIISAFTIDPVKTGFQEYETQIGAVQTILANTESKGSTLQDVNKALDELNTYADKTIYNFTEMTKNIGTFTAAGIDLDTSVKSIQGIANLAAVSGSTSQQASTAMYQLSQALSSGTVKLMDWNSVVNAGMGGQVFQDALIMTAGRLSGTTKSVAELKEELTGTFGSFRESLQDGWITSEVLTKTLEHFTMAAEEGSAQWNVFMKQLKNEGYTEEQAKEIIQMANTATDAATKVKTLTQLWSTLQETAQSGWTQTWEIIVGDFEEAKEFYTEISNTLGGMIDGMSQARNKILEGALSSGWKQLLGTGIVDEQEYKNSITEVAKAHGVSMDEMIKAEKELDKTISDSEAYDRALKKGLKEGKLNADMLTEAIGTMTDKMSKMSDEELLAAGYTYEDVEAMKQLNESFKNGTLSMDEYVKKLFEISGREKLIEALRNAFKGLMSIIKPIGDAFNEIFHFDDTEGMIQNVKGIVDAILEFSKKLTVSEETADKIKRTFKGLFAVMAIVLKAFRAVAMALEPVVGWFGKLFGWVLDGTAWLGDFLVKLDEFITRNNVFGKSLIWIEEVLKGIWNVLKPVGAAIADVLLIPAWEVLTAALDKLGIRFDWVSDATVSMKDAVTSAFSEMSSEFKNSRFYNLLVKLWEIIKLVSETIFDYLGRALDWLATAIKNANIDTVMDLLAVIFTGKLALSISNFVDGIKSAIETFSDGFQLLGDTLDAFQTRMKADALYSLSKALLLIVAAVILMSLIPADKLAVSAAALSTFLFEFTIIIQSLEKINWKKRTILKSMAMLVAIAFSMTLMANAIRKLGKIPVENLVVASAAIVGALFALMGAVNLVPSRQIDKIAGTLIGMGIALNIFATAIRIIGNMSIEQVAIAVTALGIGLLGMVGALHLLPRDVAGRAGNMIIMAAAMTVLGGALKIFATMSWDEMVVSLTALAGSLGILITALSLMGSAKGAILGALSILIITPALVALAGVLKLLGVTLNEDEIARSLTALGGALGILAIGLTAMRGAIPGAIAMLVVAPAILVLSTALATLGVLPMNTIGIGLLAIAGAFVVLGIAGATLSTVAPVILILATSILMLSASVGVAGIGLTLMAAGVAAMSAALAGGATLIVTAIKTIILGIAGLIPELIKIWGKAVIEFCKAIIDAAPFIKDAFKAILTNLVALFVECIPMFVDGFLQLIIGVLEALGANVVELGERFFTFILALFDILLKYTPELTTKIFDFIIMAINGLAERMPELIQAGVNLIMSILQGVIDAMNNIDPSFLEEAIKACWQLVEVLGALSVMGLLVPTAMAGVLAMGLLAAELIGVLWVFGEIAQIPGLMEVVGDGGNLLQAVGKGIGQFCGGIVGGFAQGVTSALPQIGSDLAGFMKNAKPFFDGIKDLNGDTLNAVANLAKAVLLLTANDIIDGIKSFFTGESSLESFAAELPKLGTGLRDMLTNTGVFTDQEIATVNCVAEMVKILAGAAKEVPNAGGLLGTLVGENDLGTFAAQFPKAGKGLRDLLTSEEGLAGKGFTTENVTTVQNVANAVVALAKASNQIPNSGGWVGAIVGENNLGTFASEFPKVGTGLRGLLTNLGQNGLTTTEQSTIGAAGAAVAALAVAAAAIPNSGGWLAKLIGDNKFENFANELPNAGKGIRGFADEIGTFTSGETSSVKAATSAIKAVADLGENIGDINKKLGDFGEKLITLGTDIKTWATTLSDAGSKTITLAISKVYEVVSMTTSVADVSVETLKTFGESLVSFAEDGILGFATALSAEEPVKTAKTGVNTIINHVITTFNATDNYTKFFNSGKYLATGFAMGISCSDSINKASNAGATIGRKALAGLNQSLDEHSPSKEAFKSGAFFTEGAINGMVDNLKSVYNAGGEVGTDAMAGLSDALSKVSDAVSLNIDSEPVIRPVVDLSNVEASASTIGSLFGFGPSVGVMANVGAISSMMNNQNGVNNDVVSAIEALRKDISNLDRPSYNINGITYDDGSNIKAAIETIVRAARIERRS